MISQAYFSPCGKYRWWLCRIWDETKPMTTFIMLNPSTADADKDDATIRRVIGFAKSFGCGGVYVVNLFGWRATKPADLAKMGHPGAFGSDIRNTAYVKHFSRKARDTGGPVVCAWGAHAGRRVEVVASVMAWMREAGINPRAFGQTKDGMPSHPLFLPRDSKLYTQEADA